MRRFIDLITESVVDEEVLDEAPRASAVWKIEIPPQYKHLKVIGRGMTSIVMEKDPETVLIFTRDFMKMEYMRDVGIARVIDSYESHAHPVQGMREFTIYVMIMPKLEKLSGNNVGLVRRACREYSDVYHEKLNGSRHLPMRAARAAAVRDTVQHFSSDENHLLYEFWTFISNYDESQFSVDLGPRNFLQKPSGEIVVIDPVVATEILTILDDHKTKVYKDREDQARYGRRW